MDMITEGTMNAAQYDQTLNKVVVNQVPIPKFNDDEILMKTICASLCHSDLMLFWGHTAEKPSTNTITIGHENTGVVVAVGQNTEGFKIGDRVGCLGCSSACYECDGCQVHNLFCEKGAQRLHGFQTAGHFAEYSTTHYKNAMVLPDGMDAISAAPLFCAGITAYHSVRGCGLEKGDWLAVIGCGGLGHLAIQYAKAMDLRVVALDVSDTQLEAAKQLGADLVCNTVTDKKYEEVVRNTTGKGCHAAAVYSASNAAYDKAPDILRINGLLMVVGITKAPLAINTLDILLGKYRIAGRSSGVPQNMAEAINFSHDHNIKPHVTVFQDIHDIGQMIELMKTGKAAGRLAITF